MRKAILPFLSAVIFVSAFNAQAADEDFKKEVEGIVKQYIDSFNKKDADGVVKVYAPDAVFVAADGHAFRGVSEIKGYIQKSLESGAKDDVADVTEAHATGDGGYAYGTWSLSVPGQGGAMVKIGGGWSGAYAKDSGGWHAKMLFISIPPPPPPPPAK